GGIQRATDIFDELLAADTQGLKINRGAGWQVAFLGRGALISGRGQGTCKDSFGDSGNRDAKVQTANGGPTAGAFLAGGVEDDIDKRLASVWISGAQYFCGDFNEVGIQVAGIPLLEDR